MSLEHSEQTTMRINKYLANQGLGSRREIDQAITDGEVLVNGVSAKLGQLLQAGDHIKYRDQELSFQEQTNIEKIYIAFNKPPGVVCTCSEEDPDNIIDYLLANPDQSLSKGLIEKIISHKIYPIGRLDKDSRGLILLTNDGDLTQKLTHPKHQHEKEYLVTCRDNLDNIFLDKFASGVKITLEDGMEVVTTMPCNIKKIQAKQFTTILKQGYKRQIREMVKALGNEVIDIYRIRISNLALKKYQELNNIIQNIIILDNLTEGRFLELEYSCLCH